MSQSELQIWFIDAQIMVSLEEVVHVCVVLLMFTGTLGFSTFPAYSAIRLTMGLALIMDTLSEAMGPTFL